MIRAGQRNKRMEIQTRGASGSTVTWTTRATRSAALVMLSGMEGIEAKKLMAGRMGHATFSYDSVTAAITPKDRLQLKDASGTRNFQIDSVINTNERNQEIVVTVIEIVL